MLARTAAIAQPPNPEQSAASAEAMRFVQQLALAVSGEPLELPSYPEVALRVQRVLADTTASAERVVKVIGSDPVLAARVISMANSAALSRGGKSATELREAVARVGFDALRSAAIGFAMAQLRKATAYRDIEKPMTILWHHNVCTAAAAYVLARRLKRVSADTALLTGLVAGVGKLYLLTQSKQYPALFADPEGSQSVLREWHPHVARSILENWRLPEEIVEAVAGYEEAAQDSQARSPLTDLIAVAATISDLRETPDLLASQLVHHRAAARLALSPSAISELLAESSTEIASLREALGK